MKSNLNTNILETYRVYLQSKKLPVLYSFNHIANFLGVEPERLNVILNSKFNHYKILKLKKKNGGYRELDCPSFELKGFQNIILSKILEQIPVSEYATGFTIGKSILQNAIPHINNDFIFNTDLKDFFPSIKEARICELFYYFGYSELVSKVLAKIVTFKGRLPQGAPTSPYLSNLVCVRLDNRISSLCKKYKYSYTRYADDITISGIIFSNVFKDIFKEIISTEKFSINPSKTSLRLNDQPKFVTGLTINNGRVKVKKKYIKKILLELHYMELYGVKNHLEVSGQNRSFYRDHIYGKAFFVKMIERDKGEKILERLDKIDWFY